MRRSRRKVPAVPAVLTLFTISALFAGIASVVSPVSAQEGSSPDDEANIELVGQTMWVEGEGLFEVLFRLLNVPSGSTIDIEVGEPIRSRTAFLDRLAEPSTGPVLHRIATLSIPEPDPDGVSSLRFTTTTLGQSITESNHPVISLPAEGVYPVSLAVRDPGGTPLDVVNTFLVRTPPPDPALPPMLVSTVLSVSGPPAVDGSGNVNLGTTGDDLQTLAAVLAPKPDRPVHPVTVSVDPHLIDALAISDELGHAELLNQLQEAGANRVITSSPYVPLAGDAWIDQGLGLRIGWQIESGAAALGEHLGRQPDRTTMVLTTSASPELLQRLQLEQVGLVVVPEALLDSANELFSSSAKTSFLLPTVDGRMRAVAIDSAVEVHFTRTDDRSVVPYLVLADLAARWFEDPQQLRGIVLAPPLSGSTPTGLETLLDEIGTSPILSAVNLQTIVENLEPDTVRQARSIEGNGFEEDYQAALNDGQRIARSYQNMVDPIATSGTPERMLIETLERALLLSGAYGLTETQRDEYLAVVAQTVRDTVAAIEPPSRRRVTLTSRSGSIPMHIHNNLDHDVIVLMELVSDKLEFPDGDTLLKTLAPGVNPVEVPVRAKTSGDSVLEISVNSPDGRLALGQSQLTVRTTSLSGVGVGIAAVSLAILLLWWARHLRSRRHLTHTQPTTP